MDFVKWRQQQQRWRRSAGAAGFSPDDIPGLELWLKADAITGANDGDPVATWADSSGNSRDATQATSTKQPTYETNELNGQPVLRFDGVDDWLEVADVNGLTFGDGSADAAFAVFVVFRLTDTASADMLVAKRGASAEYWIGTQASGVGTNFSLGDGGTAARIGRLDTGGIAGATAYILSNLYDATEAASGATIWRNGVQVDDSDDVGGVYVAMENTTDPLYLGTYGAGSEPLKGDLAEVLIYRAALTTGQREQIEDYLATKYGITL